MGVTGHIRRLPVKCRENLQGHRRLSDIKRVTGYWQGKETRQMDSFVGDHETYELRKDRQTSFIIGDI